MGESLSFTSGLTKNTITFGTPGQGDGSIANVFFTGLMGAGLAPVDNYVVDTAYQPGAQFVRTKIKPAVLTAYLTIFGDPNNPDVRGSLWDTVDQILAVLHPALTSPGTLAKTDSRGVTRVLKNAQYMGGHEIDDHAQQRAYLQLQLVFEAYDPTWYSQATHNVQVGASSDPSGFIVPFTVPLTIAGQAQGNAIITNAGNIYAQPVFTFNGPCVNYSITNQTTGESFAITKQLFTGDTLVVDTLQGTVTYTPAGGASVPLYSAFAGARQWVRLAPGTNTMQFFRDVAGNQQCTITWSDTWNHG